MKINLDNAYDYLQKYCVIEVACMIFFAVMFFMQIDFIFKNIKELTEWQCAVLAPFAMANFGMIKECFSSINIEYKK